MLMTEPPDDDQRIGLAGGFQGFFQAFGVLAAVLELERVDRHDLLADFVAAFGVQKGIEPGARTDAVVVRTVRADVLVFFQVVLVQHRVAAGAFDPQALGHGAASGGVGVGDFRGQQLFKPGHGSSLLGWP
jgi:hypothetical protein